MTVRIVSTVLATYMVVFVVLFGIFAWAAPAQERRQTQVLCMPFEVLVRTAAQRGEHPAVTGDVFPDTNQSPFALMLFVNKDNGEFTFAGVNRQTKTACVLAAGYNWKPVPPLPAKKP
jgi:hypothetical protein